MTLRRTYSLAFLIGVLSLASSFPVPAAAQAARPAAFLAQNYDVSASLDAIGQSLSATAKIDFKAVEASSSVRVELHPNLIVKEVKGADGKPLTFTRDNQNPLFVIVQLPTPVATDGHVTLTFTYAGLLVNEENSPIPGVRAALINKDGAYLLLPARWFPLTNFPSNRYTATFRLNVPDVFAVAGTGKAGAPTPTPGKNAVEGGRLLYTFECKSLAPHGTFVAGNLQLNPKQAEGVSVAVYAPRAASANAADFAASVARSVVIFSDMFGPIPDPTFSLIQIPDSTLREYAAPGVLLLSQRAWDPKASDRTIARLVASQWWGVQVLPATPGDVWISDGLARYSEALYAEQNTGKEAGLRAVDEFAVGALMYEDAAPVAQAARLAPYSPDYRSVVLNKGAMIFHMLRAQMGDVPFKAALHDFYFQFAEKTARIDDFENIALRRSQASAKPPQEPPNLRGFFAQWLNSTGVPEFSLEYVVYRTPKGFRVNGKIKQPLDTFHMPVDLRIDTEGNPEQKTIDVTGTESGFTVETFGRPKPGGIKVDPNNVILKGSTSLRARAAIARGEDLAEKGLFYDAVTQYQRALSIQPNRPLANFRMGEAFFYQKNYQAAANAFRESLQTVPEPGEKWTEVWSHIYLGKIFDMLGQRERAVNEYSKAKQTNDDTGGAQAVAESFLKKPYSEGGTSVAAPAATDTAKPASANIPPPASGEKPVLKKPDPPPQPFTGDSYLPIKTKAGDEGVTAYEAQWYGKSLERMKEPRLPDFAKDVNVDVYRMMILPTWGNSIVVRVQRDGKLYNLSARRLDGQAGYDPGKLVETKNIDLTTDDSNALEALIQNLNFFQFSTNDDVRGHDGDEWILEGVSQGKYHLVQRWCAPSYDPQKRRLIAFLALCKFLLDKSTLSERPKNKGQKLI